RVNYTLCPMKPPDGASSVRATSQLTLQPGETISGEANQGKPTYASTVTTENQSSNAPRRTRESVIARITTYNGILPVIIKAKDYYGIMAEECRLTIIGRFLKVNPQIDQIMSFFKELIPIKGPIIIGMYDNHYVFLDFTNEDDFNLLWFKRVLETEGLQKWTLDFKPNRTSLLHPCGLIYQRVNYTLRYMEPPDKAPSTRSTSQLTLQLGATISGKANQGKPTYATIVTTANQSANALRHPRESVIARITTHNGISAVIFKAKDYYDIMEEEYMDIATNGRTRPNIAKIRVEIDLLKPHPKNVWVGLEDEASPLRGILSKA
ncbi:hypothetical protein H5410_003132, partial [Solanum commersonii]